MGSENRAKPDFEGVAGPYSRAGGAEAKPEVNLLNGRTAPTCRRCPADIIFARQRPSAKNPYPKSNPLNAQPMAQGNLRLDKQTMTYDVLTGAALEAARAAGEELYLSHFANCQARAEFRRKKAER